MDLYQLTRKETVQQSNNGTKWFRDFRGIQTVVMVFSLQESKTSKNTRSENSQRRRSKDLQPPPPPQEADNPAPSHQISPEPSLLSVSTK